MRKGVNLLIDFLDKILNNINNIFFRLNLQLNIIKKKLSYIVKGLCLKPSKMSLRIIPK